MSEAMEVTEYVPSSIDLLGTKRAEQVLRLKYDVAHIMQAIMEGPSPEKPSGVHYGPSFPGSRKNSLLLPGAHTLASTFGLTPRYDITEIPEGKGRRYQIKANLYSRSGLFLGEGIGEASTEEEKFAWQEVVCEAQYVAADPTDVRIKYKRDSSQQGYSEVKQIRTTVADKSNTALKIAKKRALVDGIILVLDCSDIFDQYFEELGNELGLDAGETAKPREAKKPKEAPSPVFAIGKWKDRRISDPEVPIDYLQWFADSMGKKLADPARAKFKQQDQLFLAALDAEIAHRKPTTHKTPPNPSKDDPGDVQTANPTPPMGQASISARKPFTTSTWADFLIWAEEDAIDDYADIKREFKVSSGHDVPEGQRLAFYDALMARTAKIQ